MAKLKQIGDVPGNVLGMLADLNHKLQHGKITPYQLDRFLKKKNPFDVIITDYDEVLAVMVNRNRTFVDGIAAGHFSDVHSNITEDHFPCSDEGILETEIILVCFAKKMGTEKVLQELDRRNLRPADFQELLAIGEQYPEERSPIIALGSIWRAPGCGQNSPGIISQGNSVRELTLMYYTTNWPDLYCFATLRK